MEIFINQHDDGTELARVKKQLKDKDGLLIGTAYKNPILYSRMYEAEYTDRYKTEMASNAIANNLLAKSINTGSV